MCAEFNKVSPLPAFPTSVSGINADSR